MPFQPGHKINEGRTGSGSNRETRKALKNLALSIREGCHPDEIRDWLIAVWKGKDPLTGEKVDLKNRAAALQMLLDRGWGQAAQHVIVEGELRTEMIANEPRKQRKPMSLEQINARRAELRALGITAKQQAEAIDVQPAALLPETQESDE